MSENDWRFQNCATGSIRRQAQSLEADIEYLPHPRRWPLDGFTSSCQLRLKWLRFSPALTEAPVTHISHFFILHGHPGVITVRTGQLRTESTWTRRADSSVPRS